MSVFPSGDPHYDAILAEESAMVGAAELIAEALSTNGMTRVELAQRLGVSKSEITARLRGERNIIVRKLAATLHELGMSLKLAIEPRGVYRRQEKQEILAWSQQAAPITEAVWTTDFLATLMTSAKVKA